MDTTIIAKLDTTIKNLRAVERELFSRDRNDRNALKLCEARIVLARLQRKAERDLEHKA